MAIPFLNHLDLRSISQVQNMILHKTTSGASSDVEGKIIYDTGTDTIKFYNGSAWISLGAEQNTTYTTSVVSDSGIKLRLTGSDASTDDIIFVGAGATAVARTDANTITITGTNTWRGVSVDTDGNGTADNTLAGAETLMLKKGTNITLAEAGGVVTISSTDTQPLTTEAVQDIVGAMFTGNTETRGSLTYQDSDGTIDLVVNDMTADVDVNVTNLTARLAQITENVTIGDASDVTVIIPGDLQVTGTTTTNNVETVSTNNGIIFEGHAADAYEGTLKGGTYTADRTYTLPDSSGVVGIGYSTTIGGATTAEVTHNLNSRNVIVQLFDTSSYETVYADVVRTSVNTVDLTFAAAPSSNDITVLVTRVA